MKKVAVVAGGSSGIGFAVVHRLLDLGYHVGFFGSSAKKMELAQSELVRSFVEERLLARKVDVQNVEEIEEFFHEVESRWGGADVLIFGAGVSPKANGDKISFLDMSLESWREVMAINLDGAMICCQKVLPRMVRNRYGRIVAIGSMAARSVPKIAGAAYVTSKSGLAGLVRSIAVEFGPLGITANTVAPGNVTSPMTGSATSAQNLLAAQRIPTGRIGEPADIVGIISFLCTEEASFINGATIDVTGGEFVTP